MALKPGTNRTITLKPRTMTTKTILKATLTLIITCGLMFSSALDDTADKSRFSMETTEIGQIPDGQLFKALVVDGKAYPLIELPVVEITGQLNTDHIVRGEMIDGELVPSIMLDEVVITPNS
jgi:hypothetical protein